MDILNQLKQAVGVNKIMEPVKNINQLAKTIESLTRLVKENKVSTSVQEMINGLMILVKNRPNVTSINHYFNHFLLQLDPENQPPVLKELLEVYHDRWRNVERKTAEIALEHLNFDEERTILLHNSDLSVKALLELLAVKNKKIKIYQTISRPDNSGKDQAIDALKLGFDVQVIDDNSVGQYLPDIDFVILGSEVIMHQDFVNKIGTHTLMAAAKHYKRPVYVLSDSRKILNIKYFPQNIVTTLIGASKKSSNEIWKKAPKGIVIENFRKEYVPNYLVDKFILEMDAFPPEELKNQIDRVMVSRFF